jgi:hypothetical protein
MAEWYTHRTRDPGISKEVHRFYKNDDQKI